jgi:Ca2+-binding RTX toxin-like protein
MRLAALVSGTTHMKKNYIAISVLGLLAAVSFGCAKPVAPEELPGGAREVVPGDGTTPDDGAGPSGNAGSTGGTGEDPTGPGEEDPTDTLPGTDTSFDTAPQGCLGGFQSGTLELTLDDEVPAVRLEGEGGVLMANGTPCTAGDDAPVTVEDVTSLLITGGAADNAVIVDLGEGDWSALLAISESIRAELGAGRNSFVVRGTAEDDVFRHGMQAGDVVLDLVGDGRISVLTEGVTALGLSMGAGDDRVEDLAAFTSGGAAPAGGVISALSVSLVAFGGDGNDTLLGGSNDDQFDGGFGDDVANGLDGNDHFSSAGVPDGADTFNGGPGYDSSSYELRQIDLVVNICHSSADLGCDDGACQACEMSGEPGEDDRLVNVEDVTGGDGDDLLRGSAFADSLSGGPGDDRLFGLGGSDVLYGQRGTDVLEGGVDGDYCDGQPGEQVVACEL